MARAVLVITIIPMVLVSIHPFAVRKIFLLALALLGLSSAVCFADPVFMTRQYAPPQDQARPVRMAVAFRANVEGHSRTLRASKNSPVAPHGLRMVRSLVPFGETCSRMDTVSLMGGNSVLWEAPTSWRSDIDSTLPLIGPADVIPAP